MAIDVKKMREKQNNLKNKNGGGNKNFWKVPDGESVIRVLPSPDGDPFKEFHFHYKVGKEAGFLCPKKNFGEDCKVCDFVQKLWKGDEADKKSAKELSVKQRFLSPILVRGEEDKGIQFYSYSKKVYEKLLGLVLNPDYGDISDAKDGIDLTLTYGKAPGQDFPNTDITPKRKSSPIMADKAEMAKILETEVDYETVFDRRSSEYVAEALDKFLSGDEPGEDVEKFGVSEDAVDAAFSELKAKA